MTEVENKMVVLIEGSLVGIGEVMVEIGCDRML